MPALQYVGTHPSNDTQSRGHMKDGAICPRTPGSLVPTLPFTTYAKDDISVVYTNSKYYLNGTNDGAFILDSYFSYCGTTIKLPTRSSLCTLEKLMISRGLPIHNQDVNLTYDIASLGNKSEFTTSFKNELHLLTTMALIDFKIIPHTFSTYKQKKYGEVIFELYLKIANGSGRINSSNQYIRYLNEQDIKQLKRDLFKLSDERSYQVGVFSMKYEPTILMESIIKKVLDLVQDIEFKVNDDLDIHELNFILPKLLLKQIKLRDIMLLLSNCIGYKKSGFIIRPSLTDFQFSRVYSVLTSISSDTRKLLGFINYDIGSALQTICMQLVDDNSLYPLHVELMNDKNSFRQKVANEASEDLAWVKKELSSADNKDSMPKKYANFPTLKSYFEEALVLRKEVIDHAEPITLARATEFAKVKWEKIGLDSKGKPIFEADGKKESSVFFFIWTQSERLIREAMINCFDNPSSCHQVHDAVYSRQDIDPKVIEDKVLKVTSFKIQISKD